MDDSPHRKRIGFLSFGHWSRGQGSQTQTAGEALRQSVDLAVAAEEIGIDGAAGVDADGAAAVDTIPAKAELRAVAVEAGVMAERSGASALTSPSTRGKTTLM